MFFGGVMSSGKIKLVIGYEDNMIRICVLKVLGERFVSFFLHFLYT